MDREDLIRERLAEYMRDAEWYADALLDCDRTALVGNIAIARTAKMEVSRNLALASIDDQVEFHLRKKATKEVDNELDALYRAKKLLGIYAQEAA